RFRLVRERVVGRLAVDVDLGAHLEGIRVERAGGNEVFAGQQVLVIEMAATLLAECPFGPVRRGVGGDPVDAFEGDVGPAVDGEQWAAAPAAAEAAMTGADLLRIRAAEADRAAQAMAFHDVSPHARSRPRKPRAA